MWTLIFWFGFGDTPFVVSNIESVTACKSIAGQIETTQRMQRRQHNRIDNFNFDFLCVDSKGKRE